MNTSHLNDLKNNPWLFENQVSIQTGSGIRKMGDIMAPFQRKRFKLINPSLLAVSKNEKPPIPRLWDERTKGSSKDSDFAVNLLWLLAFTPRSLRIQVGAYDREQASETQQIVRQILRIDTPINRILNQLIEVRQFEIRNPRTNSRCEILTTDKFGSHGARPDFVLLNELTHQQKPEFADTLLDNLAKNPNGLGMICTNAGFDPSWQLDWKNNFTDDPLWKIIQYTGTPPWITPELLNEAERRNSRNRFLRLFRGCWVSETESALSFEDIESAVTESAPMDRRERGYFYYAGLDIGLKKHATAFVVVGKHIGWREEKEIEKPKTRLAEAMMDLGYWEPPTPEYEILKEDPTSRIRLAYTQTWKPTEGRVSLDDVKSAIILAHQKYNLQSICMDPFQGEYLAEQLQKEGVPVKLLPQTTASLQDQATNLVEVFQQRMIDLFDDADLIADLKRLQLFDNGQRVRLKSPESDIEGEAGTVHGDLAAALSFAISEARAGKFTFSQLPSDYQLICG